jgi:hypothetical protein
MEGIIQAFPEYEMITDETGKRWIANMYKGIDVGRGGYVYSVPGIYRNVALCDVASMHPHSIIAMNYFGEYTKNYADLVNARVAIKHRDFDTLRTLLDGKLEKYTHDEEILATLDKVLKYPINATYGESAAKHTNRFRDERNINNIVALRGALFMVDLKEAVEKEGYKVCHIKTDSIKIPDSDEYIVDFVQKFAVKYGYTMEHEATYDRICLVNKSTYIAKYDAKGIRNKGGKHANEWTATGAEFQHPYIFKTLFSHEPILFADYCETKSVKGDDDIYLDMNKDLVRDLEKDANDIRSKILEWPKGVPGIMDIKRKLKAIENEIESIHSLKFVGKCGQFTPVDDAVSGGVLIRSLKDSKTGTVKYQSVSGSIGYRWLESYYIKKNGLEDHIDMRYFRKLVDDACGTISKFGDVDEFING